MKGFLHRHFRLLFGGLVLASLLTSATQSNAQTPQGSTAVELLNRGAVAFNAGDYATAEKAISEFVTGYGTSAEAKEALPRALPILALSQVYLKKFKDAGESVDKALADTSKLSPTMIEDLRFWKGVCAMQEKDYEEARKAFSGFIDSYPQSVKRADVFVMHGSSFLLEEKYKEADEALTAALSSLKGRALERATVLLFYARLESGALDSALRLLVEEYPRFAERTQTAAFQMMSLELGAQFLEKEELRKAIATFQRVWRRDRVIEHQTTRSAALNEQLAALKAQKAPAAVIFQTEQDVIKAGTDLAAFEKLENFDSALQLRLATAYQKMQRYREAALIMEDMLHTMPPDSVVESASLNLIQCWSEIEHWARAADAAKLFLEKFPKSVSAPIALLLQGQALSELADYPAAVTAFGRLAKEHQKHDLAGRGWFLKGYNELLAENNTAAIETFEAFPKKFPKDALAETAFYWRGMASSLAKRYDEARAVLAAYLKQYKAGAFVADAEFRRAYVAQSAKNYPTAIAELRAFLKKHPQHDQQDEALVLLGDGLMATGELDQGIDAYKGINPQSVRFFEEGWFKTGKALRLQEKNDALRGHMEKFCKEHAKSPRVAEAVYWIGWAWRQAEQPEKARAAYLRSIKELGNDPAARAVEDLIFGLQKLAKTPEEHEALLENYRAMRRDSDAEGNPVLAMRMLWAQAQMLAKADPAQSDRMLIEASTRADEESVNPQLLADFASALERSGKTKESEAMFRDLLKWNPRAPQKDRVFAALGKAAQKAGKDKDALKWYARFAEETPDSVLFGEVMMAKARIEIAETKRPEARKTLEALLASKATPGKMKAEALVTLGDSWLQDGNPKMAVPYFQRVYVMYGRHREQVAKAYQLSGKAFEALGDSDAAKKTAEEFAAYEAGQGGSGQ